MSASAKKKPVSPVALLPLPTVDDIFGALSKAGNFVARSSQKQLAAIVRDTFAKEGVCVVEAPTGTGKTLGYFAGMLDYQAHAGKPLPVVVATATIGLQEQIIEYDIPRLAAEGILDPRKVAIAKGRGRYFCPRTAALLEEKKAADSQFDMFEPQKEVAEAGRTQALEMLKSWREQKWDGDKDSWSGAIPACWDSACGASADTCVNRACEHFQVCPYMLSRAKLANAQLIIANHDIVLADLAQRADEQKVTTLPHKRYAIVFDEAHNLPEKAISTRRAEAHLSDSAWLHELETISERLLLPNKISKALSKGTDFTLSTFSEGAANLRNGVTQLAQELANSLTFHANGISSWGLGTPNPALMDTVFSLAVQAVSVLNALKAAGKAYTELADEAVGAEKGLAVSSLSKIHKLLNRAKALQEGLSMFCSETQYVRWARRDKEGQIMLHTQPVEGCDVLSQLLWKTDFPVAMVSATLQIAGSFDRFRKKTGLPAAALTEALPAVFDYSRGHLHLPVMACEPNEAGYQVEIADKLKRCFDANVSPGMLVLFTSREMMRSTLRMMPAELTQYVLSQDEKPIAELIATHRDRIDKGRRSALFGLNTMAEGLDLPGAYCGHVIVTRLPFAVPGDPVEMARQELMGTEWFQEAYLADMLIMLIQATGRLIRREADYGVITVLDKRLTTKKYSSYALKALPPFTVCTALSEYRRRLPALTPKGQSRPMLVSVTEKVVAPESKGSKPMLSLVHDIAGTVVVAPISASAPAVLPVANVATPSATPAPAPQANKVTFESIVTPLAEVMSASDKRMRNGLAVSHGHLQETLMSLLPPEQGPFPEDEEPYLASEQPALPPGTPMIRWAERHLPQATMLGLLVANRGVRTTLEPWEQVLRLRADLIQYLEVLRSHQQGIEDSRCREIPAWMCEQQINRGLAGLNVPTMDTLLETLDEIEAETVSVLSDRFTLPSDAMLFAQAEAAQKLARFYR